MTSNRPYLLRAIYQWILDNNLTPHILVDAGSGSYGVPAGFIDDGKVVLNISPVAAQALDIGGEQLAFKARFDGIAVKITIPVTAILAIYAKENGRGMVLPEEESGDGQSVDQTPGDKKPHLKIVK